MFDEIDKDIRAMMRGIQQQQERVDADAAQIQILEDRLRTKAQMLRREKEALIVAMYERRGMFSAAPEAFFEMLGRVDRELRHSESTLTGRGELHAPAQREDGDPRSGEPLANFGGVDHCLVTIHRLTNPTIVVKEELRTYGLTKNGRKGIWCGKVSRDAALILRGRFGDRVTIEDVAPLEDTRVSSSLVDAAPPDISAIVLNEEPTSEKSADNMLSASSDLRAVFGVAEHAGASLERAGVDAPNGDPEKTNGETNANLDAPVVGAGGFADLSGDEKQIDPPAALFAADIGSEEPDCRSEPASLNVSGGNEAAAASSAPLLRQGARFNHAAFGKARAAAAEAARVSPAPENAPHDAAMVKGPPQAST
ncbi:hypothetical protein [Methylosinus sp. LW4]|uniref:hypothetical protein n=1 Tax=Methylosinus sp. LW4 TaxID=136993 RepID=UPI00036F5B33|nr:hypothetical protein [Methylosinus sp. LW4]